jgi:hypothetical protein
MAHAASLCYICAGNVDQVNTVSHTPRQSCCTGTLSSWVALSSFCACAACMCVDREFFLHYPVGEGAPNMVQQSLQTWFLVCVRC